MWSIVNELDTAKPEAALAAISKRRQDKAHPLRVHAFFPTAMSGYSNLDVYDVFFG